LLNKSAIDHTNLKIKDITLQEEGIGRICQRKCQATVNNKWLTTKIFRIVLKDLTWQILAKFHKSTNKS